MGLPSARWLWAALALAVLLAAAACDSPSPPEPGHAAAAPTTVASPAPTTVPTAVPGPRHFVSGAVSGQVWFLHGFRWALDLPPGVRLDVDGLYHGHPCDIRGVGLTLVDEATGSRTRISSGTAEEYGRTLRAAPGGAVGPQDAAARFDAAMASVRRSPLPPLRAPDAGADGIPILAEDAPVRGGSTYRLNDLLLDVPASMYLTRAQGSSPDWDNGSCTLSLIDEASGSVLAIDGETGEERGRIVRTASGEAETDVSARFDALVASARRQPLWTEDPGLGADGIPIMPYGFPFEGGATYRLPASGSAESDWIVDVPRGTRLTYIAAAFRLSVVGRFLDEASGSVLRIDQDTADELGRVIRAGADGSREASAVFDAIVASVRRQPYQSERSDLGYAIEAGTAFRMHSWFIDAPADMQLISFGQGKRDSYGPYAFRLVDAASGSVITLDRDTGEELRRTIRTAPGGTDDARDVSALFNAIVASVARSRHPQSVGSVLPPSGDGSVTAIGLWDTATGGTYRVSGTDWLIDVPAGAGLTFVGTIRRSTDGPRIARFADEATGSVLAIDLETGAERRRLYRTTGSGSTADAGALFDAVLASARRQPPPLPSP